MSLNNTLKKIILSNPKNISNRAEALVYLFLSHNSYCWKNGELILNGPSRPAYKASLELPAKTLQLIENMARVNQKEADFLEQAYIKAQKKEVAKINNITSKVDRLINSKDSARVVQFLSSKSAVMNMPEDARPEWRAAAVESLTIYLAAHPSSFNAFFMLELLSA